MAHDRQHTATYQVQTFIASEHSHHFKLIPLDVLILFIIARYLDMPKRECFGKQNLLARECRTDRFRFSRRCIHLEKNGLIFRFTRGKLYHYELGESITGIAQEIVM